LSIEQISWVGIAPFKPFFVLYLGMKMTFNIDRIIIDLQMETDGLRLITESENLLLSNQTYEETKQTIEKNYKIVKDYFLPKINSIGTVK
jgi:hypothetical protein